MVEKGWDIFTIDDRVVVDRVCRYEDMENELEFGRLGSARNSNSRGRRGSIGRRG